MSATPIPRTLGLILYGDLDVSIIGEMPPGRVKIDTYGVDSSYSQRVYDFIKKELSDGRQAYVVCPSIEAVDEESNLKLQNVTDKHGELSGVFDGYNVGMLHGKMSSDEKTDIINRFLTNEIHVLVATTVIEVGVNVPNATVMLVVDADRFGLSQLHQLRGRVGRSAHKSYCILQSDSRTKTAKERIKAMAKTSDGFEISELDLKQRGPGDFFGTRQHGLVELKIADFYRDMEVIRDVADVIDRGEDKGYDNEISTLMKKLLST
jgi:ATP-dependent DNA helicase RecG